MHVNNISRSENDFYADWGRAKIAVEYEWELMHWFHSRNRCANREIAHKWHWNVKIKLENK